MEDELIVILNLTGALSYFVITSALDEHAGRLEAEAAMDPLHAPALLADAAEARSLARKIEDQILV
ncbi:hypothetical protein [Microbacterium sp. 22242]|uniref:hypothetical protein n=1 Tax=Microbacterium sp. 22242 TaxID=3453896 RepID=UPI003F85E955